MKKVTFSNNHELSFELEYKRVKNVNLRIRADGSVYVSANRHVSLKTIETFILSKESFILKALENIKSRERLYPEALFSEDDLRKTITNLCKAIYPYYKELGKSFPEIRFKKMTSRWGSCHPIKNILTFNLALKYAPIECIEYVVWHEFTHFLHPNHGEGFYEELEKVCPAWKTCRKKLKEIPLQKH